jgi:type VI secretion system protein VasG
VQVSPKPIILFIDEAHTLIGAGGSAGQGDAANLLKPALARGTLRTIAATTWGEYKKYFEKDPALTRRFQVIKIEEPSEHKTVLMIRGLSPILEKHHKVDVLDEALIAAAQLSHRYIPSRQLPDKAVSLIDTACARVAISQHATPPEVEDSARRLSALQTELEILGRESAVGIDHEARRAEIAAKLEEEKENQKRLDAHWQQEKESVEKILALRRKLRDSSSGDNAAEAAVRAEAPQNQSGDTEDKKQILGQLRTLEKELTGLQGETPLVFPSVDEQAVASVVADWTGIPVGRMVKNEIQAVLSLADNLEKRVIGQRYALETIARRIQTSRARLDNPNRPIGVFMLVGPSGIGKTETALALAEALYGGEQNMISINMSEFQEAHTVSTLKGSPPGYVGYGEGGILTEAVRRRPYSVILLDEVEKAHHDVHEIFFQVFDKGWMEDAEGRHIDFKNTIIILTTNAAQDMIVNMCKDPALLPDPEGLEKAMRVPLTKVFPDALLNRLVVVPYYPITKEILQRIIKLNLSRVEKRVKENQKVPFTYDDNVPELIAQRCTELERGARMVDTMITNTILPEIGREFLTRLANGSEIKRVHIMAKEGNFVFSYD